MSGAISRLVLEINLCSNLFHSNLKLIYLKILIINYTKFYCNSMLLLFRIVFSTRSTTTPHFVCSTKEVFVLMEVLFVIDGILHLMAQNVQNQLLLKELFTLNQPESIPIVTVILKVTVTRLLKVTYVWDSG